MPAEDDVIDTSQPVRITVHPEIEGNTIGDPATLCYGQNPATLISKEIISGGSGIYQFNWELSTDGSAFTTPANTHGNEHYTPAPAPAASAWYRRTVTSGRCVSVSDAVKLTLLPAIENNIPMLVSGLQDTALCIGGTGRLTGSTPTGGNGISYTYQWQASTNNQQWSAAGTGSDFTPPPLSQTTWFRRTVVSEACEDTSATAIKVTVWQPIAGNTIPAATETCAGYAPQPLAGGTPTGGNGTYLYRWEQSSDGGATWAAAQGENSDPSGAYQPPVLNAPMKYRRTVMSGTASCYTDISNTADITLYPAPSSAIDAGPDTLLYSFDRYYPMQALPLYTYETGQWSTLAGSGSFDSNTRSNARLTALASGTSTFMWTVTNGPCVYNDTVSITLKEIFIPNGFSPNGDGVNDCFEILGLDPANQHAELSIVNSAGAEVFRTSNRGGHTWNNWNGKTSGGADLAESTYYYRLTLESKNTAEPPYTKKGFIVLKRK
jgi:gliding motility-associated-like protein